LRLPQLALSTGGDLGRAEHEGRRISSRTLRLTDAVGFFNFEVYFGSKFQDITRRYSVQDAKVDGCTPVKLIEAIRGTRSSLRLTDI
jgi:hypothetical protein